MKKLQIIMLFALYTAASTEITKTMWGRSAEPAPKHIESLNSMIENQQKNLAKTNEVAKESENLQQLSQKSAQNAAKLKQQAQDQYNNSLAVKAVDAMTNSATKAWNWMTGKSETATTTNQSGSIDLEKTRSNSNPETTKSTTKIDNKPRSASDQPQNAPFGVDSNGKPYRSKLAATLDPNNPNKAASSNRSTSPTTVATDLPATKTSFIFG